MEEVSFVFDKSFVQNTNRLFSNLPANEQPSVFHLITKEHLQNEKLLIEETWGELSEKYGKTRFNQWLDGIRSYEKRNFCPFWFHFLLYDWLKKYGDVIPEPRLKKGLRYNPDFEFLSKDINIIIEARTFITQGNDAIADRIQIIIENILMNYKTEYWIGFSVSGFDHFTKYNEIEKGELQTIIVDFLDKWLSTNPENSSELLILPNQIEISFVKSPKSLPISSSYGSSSRELVALNDKRFINEMKEKIEKFSWLEKGKKLNFFAIFLENPLEVSFSFYIQLLWNNKDENFVQLLQNIDGFLIFKAIYKPEDKRRYLVNDFIYNHHKPKNFDIRNIFPDTQDVISDGHFN